MQRQVHARAQGLVIAGGEVCSGSQAQAQAGVEEFEQGPVLARLFSQPREQAQQLVAGLGLAMKTLQQARASSAPRRRSKLLIAPRTQQIARSRNACLDYAGHPRI
ncbi:MAG TPA: hypothetical protein VLJ86_21735, partial [Ramlibacter sp.]|nr:hypothetical protein [Ramlibacter sp.]